MGLRRTRRRRDDNRAADRITAALALIRQTDERWHGLALWPSHSGMDRDAELLDRLAAQAAGPAGAPPGRGAGRTALQIATLRATLRPRWVKPLLPARRAACRKFPGLSKPAFSAAIRHIADLW